MDVRTDKPDQVDVGQFERANSRSRFLTIVAMVLAVALLGLGVWVVYDLTTSPETAVTAEIDALIDDYLAAYNTYDGEAFVGVITDGYVLDMVGRTGAITQQVEETVAMINNLEGTEWNVAVIGERIMTGDGPWYVSQVEHFTGTGYGSEGADGVSTFTVVDDGGTLKIARHDFVGNN